MKRYLSKILLWERRSHSISYVGTPFPCVPAPLHYTGDDHTDIFACDGCARDPYFYVPAETQSYVIKLSCSRKVLAASGD